MEIIIDNHSVFVDEVDLDVIGDFKWRLNKDGYVVRSDSKNKTVFLHKEIFNKKYVQLKDQNLLCDHIDRDKLNCQRSNLRPATKAENCRNVALRSDNTTGYKGVTSSKYGYEVRINIEGKPTYLGSYATPEDAAIIYNRNAKEIFGEFAWLNPVIDNGQQIKSLKDLKQSIKLCGVYKSGNRYRSRVTVDGKKISLGTYNTELDAAKAYDDYLLTNNLVGKHYRLNNV